MPKVLDSSTVLAYVLKEAGGAVTLQILLGSDACYIHFVNLCEIYYNMLRDFGRISAEDVVEELRNNGVIVREDSDEPFWKAMAELKTNYKVSLGDTFCVTLAQRLGATLITKDRHELEPLHNAGVVSCQFIV